MVCLDDIRKISGDAFYPHERLDLFNLFRKFEKRTGLNPITTFYERFSAPEDRASLESITQPDTDPGALCGPVSGSVKSKPKWCPSCMSEITETNKLYCDSLQPICDFCKDRFREKIGDFGYL